LSGIALKAQNKNGVMIIHDAVFATTNSW